MNVGNTETSIYLNQWHKGNRESLASLLQRHLPWIHAQVRERLTPLLRGKEETWDYVQDAVLQFLQYGPRFTISNDVHFRAILMQVVKNSMLNKYDWYTARRREISRERPLPPDTILSLDLHPGTKKTPSISAERHEQEAWIRLGLEFVEPGDREVIVLRRWDELSFAEIGAQIGITSEAARKRYTRAVDRLSEKVWDIRSGNLPVILE
jgi:RNA polymerase sigma-70 factor (ECF subfamily)